MIHPTTVLIFAGVLASLYAFTAALMLAVAWGSGWRALARRYPFSGEEPTGLSYVARTSVGWMPYEGRAGADKRGLYLHPYPRSLFQWTHPPVLIPWSDVATVRTESSYGGLLARFELADGSSVTLRPPTFELLKAALEAAGAPIVAG